MTKRVKIESRPRINVLVNGEKFASAQSAFRHFKLPLASLRNVRNELRESGKATIKTSRKAYGFKVGRA